MNPIQVLPPALINQIAAGEVVERPASVVKELVENSLDAGATRVDVAIVEGGTAWISVEDDGSGLSRPEAELAFQRHATSKIRSAEDLARVGTLGFRGEALPSIASVSRVRMRTRRAADEIGCELSGEGDGIAGVREVACSVGTRVEVAELFARVPARRKFLKSALTEASHVARWLERIALARPELRLFLERDGRPALLFLPTSDVRERAIAVLPPSVGERLLPIDGRNAFAWVRGFASPTDVRRGSTGDIHLFVNGRPVRDRLLLFAVRDAYRDALPPGRHPVAVLHLEIETDQIDVNVHPAKWEVRFLQPDAVRRLVRDALVAALGLGARATSPRPPASDPFEGVRHVAEGGPHVGSFALALPPTEAVGRAPAEHAVLGEADFAFRSLRYLGQALGTYLLFEAEGAIVLIDQHAAHERVLFERLRAGLFDGKLERQALLLPVRLELPRSEADALRGAGEALERAGFEIDVEEGGLKGGVQVAIRAVPSVLASCSDVCWSKLLEETAAALRDPGARESRDGLEGALHGLLATAACHAATRKGDRLAPEEVDALLVALDETIWFPNCPHGRPILSVVDGNELERRFLRR
ncbi:MAG: DNA mismatch repair endonuclease MutL [Myxococcota bacterium]